MTTYDGQSPLMIQNLGKIAQADMKHLKKCISATLLDKTNSWNKFAKNPKIFGEIDTVWKCSGAMSFCLCLFIPYRKWAKCKFLSS